MQPRTRARSLLRREEALGLRRADVSNLTVAAARSFEKVAVVAIMGHADSRLSATTRSCPSRLDASARMHALLGEKG